MIEIIQGLPAKVAAFKATGAVTEDDYIKTVNPLCDKVYREFGKINYLMEIDTPLRNYSAGAWIKDALLGFIYFTDWRKIAIVSETKSIKDFTNIFGIFIPGKTKGFLTKDLNNAIHWVSK